MQHSTYSLLSTLPLLAALLLGEARFFQWLVLASACAVFSAALLFSLFSVRALAQQRQATSLPTLPDQDAWTSQDDEL